MTPVPSGTPSSWRAPRAPRAPLALLVVVVISGLLPLTAPAAQASPPTSAPATARWWWPLDDAAGPPTVLRRASLPGRPWQPGHRGVDLAAAAGQTVLAPVSGVVVAGGGIAGRGVLSIRSSSGWRATLEPVDSTVRVGDRVERGQPVGTVQAEASSAHCAPTSCLHWGVRTGSGTQTRYLDPLTLLRPRVVLLPVPGWGTRRDTGPAIR